MQIAQDTVVHFHYTLTSEAGQVLDSSEGNEPLGYLHGNGNIIPGLEKALDGRSLGEKFEVSIPPAEAYGEHDQSLLQAVPKSAFQGLGELQPGMQFQAQTDQGPRIVTIAAVAEDSVTVDGNHPLAGQTLNFAIEVAGIREATATELEHGHVHGVDGSAEH
jgi:FKBP-type peptidyl-prolyl cis-trans isomerase SlyD